VTSNSSDDTSRPSEPPAVARVPTEELARLQAAVEGERANALHWRERAEREAAALRALRRRPSVRLAIGIERRCGPVIELWRRARTRTRRSQIRARRARSDAAHLVITTAVPSRKVAARWGDWHLANDLARAVGRLGYRVRVQTADQVDDVETGACAVHLVLRGLQPTRPVAGPRHVLWVVSHPETVDERDCDEADLVLVASERFAAELRARTATPVEVLLQATDHHRFFPRRPDPRYDHPVAVVAKTRDVMRPIVGDALAAGLRPAIFGSGWEAFVDSDLIVADYVPNDELPVLYSSVGVLLNDHWDTMRAWGFVSNRLFDALACATPVVSDPMPEIATMFGGAVPTYRDPDELHALVTAALDDAGAARRRADRGRAQVLARHTFDHRARHLVDALGRYGLLTPL
jgi:O-antigen biosynthesis protein